MAHLNMPSARGWDCRDMVCKSRGRVLWKLCLAPPPFGKRGKIQTPLLFPQHCLVNTDLSLPSSPGPGGTHCLGASVEHAVCENLPCPKGLPSFRDQQCQTHDRLSSKKKGLLTAVVVDGKGIWHVLSQCPPLLQECKHLLGKPTGPPLPSNPSNRTLQSCYPRQQWACFSSSGVELG